MVYQYHYKNKTEYLPYMFELISIRNGLPFFDLEMRNSKLT